jgi:hypothetical protein
LKIKFLCFLLVVNAFLISYAYGLNSCRVKVIDPSLPPVEVKKEEPKPAEAKKPLTKPAASKTTTTKTTTHTSSNTTHVHAKHATHPVKKAD